MNTHEPSTSAEASRPENGDGGSTSFMFLSAQSNRVQWSTDRVVRRICERQRAGLPMDAKSARQDAGPLFGAARRLFGSWGAALQTAGVSRVTESAMASSRSPYPARRSPEALIALLKKRLQNGESLSSAQPELICWRDCAKRSFGSWVAARRLAGDTLEAPPDFTTEEVIAFIQRRLREGLTLSCHHPDIRPYMTSVRQHFGTWRRAREAAGDRSMPERSMISRDQLLAVLRERARAGLPMFIGDPELRRYRWPVRRLFGSWGEALKAVYDGPGLGATAPGVLRAIIAAMNAGRPLTCRHSDLSRYETAARRHFGTWTAAVARARSLRQARARGFVPAGKIPDTREGFINFLRQRVELGLSVSSKHPEVHSYRNAAIRLFGSWAEARAAAGAPFTRCNASTRKTDGDINRPNKTKVDCPSQKT